MHGRTSQRQLEPEVFNGIVWNIEIQNKYRLLRNFIEGYSVQLRIDGLEQWIGLLWQRLGSDLPVSYVSGTGLVENSDYRHEYQVRLGHDYSEALERFGTETGDINENQPRELYFLITFQDTNYAFLITSSSTTVAWHNNMLSKRIDERFLLYPIPSDGDIRLRMRNKVLRYKLQVRAYNDIQLHRKSWLPWIKNLSI